MGFVVLGIAAAAWAAGTENAIFSINGAVLQMVTHGLSSAGMFFMVGVIYDRTHTRDLNEFGGLYTILPVYGSILVLTSMASLGLPGLAGFVSEFLVVRGAWPVFMLATAISMIGLFFTGAYVLKGIKLVLHGPLNERWSGKISEMNFREIVVMAPLLFLMILIGIWPGWILDIINRAVMMWY
jgi:NADH-quinone oxidoreductase subunit M